MKFLNLNALQTYITILLTLTPLAMVSLGCLQLPGGGLDCSASMIPPKWALIIMGALGFIKLGILPLLQPGGPMRNLFSEKVPVSESAAPGTVLPEQVIK